MVFFGRKRIHWSRRILQGPIQPTRQGWCQTFLAGKPRPAGEAGRTEASTLVQGKSADRFSTHRQRDRTSLGQCGGIRGYISA